jgi:geranylgeranyl pyrophosphate synthase
MPNQTTNDIIVDLNLGEEFALLQEQIDAWVSNSNPEMREALEWQFRAGSKYFRPLTIFSCHRALSNEPVPPSLIRAALVLEMFHNVSLIIDDIVDKSSHRRGKHTLHCQFGELPALMVSGYIVADGFEMISDEACYEQGPSSDGAIIRYNLSLFSELLKRLGAAECMQWRMRRQPLGVEDWRRIGGEDTGSMFEVCACLGGRAETLRQFGHLLGLLYHGCDDVGDVRGSQALGGGGDEDIREGILTLPAALAIRDPSIAEVFCRSAPETHDLDILSQAFIAKLPEAEQYLDRIADEAKEQARLFSRNPDPLLYLVDHTRQLSLR